MKQLRIYLLLMILFVMGTAQAQVQEPPLPVYVTVQDNAALRAGPGTSWERLTVVPFGETFKAVGRTIDADWIQIAYEGELDEGARTEFTIDGVTYGWIASWLLIWTGNILELPIDGVTPVTITRASGPLLAIGPGTRVYKGTAGPAYRVESPASSPVLVEATGRLGSTNAGYYWLQFKMRGEYYWISGGGYSSVIEELPDASYLYAYGRLATLLQKKTVEARQKLNDIGGRWQNLDSGQPVTCNNIPEDMLEEGFTESDLRSEPLYAPAGAALDEVRLSLNSALAAFRDVCAQSTRVAASEVVQTALDGVRNANQYLNILEDWVIPFQRRDPLLGQTQPATPTP